MSAISVIGMVAGAFQSIKMDAALFVPPQHDSHTKVRVYAGISSDAQVSTNGNIPGTAVWSSSGSFVGKAMGMYNYFIGQGQYYDLELKGQKETSAYISIDAFGKTPICVAAVAVSSPTGAKSGWFGDIGMQCGAPWYPSNFAVPSSQPEIRPACVWITQGGGQTYPYSGLTAHLPSFTGDGLAQEYNNNTDALCKSLPRFSMWKSRSVHMTLPTFMGGIEFNSDGSDKNMDAILNPTMMESQTTSPQDPTGNALGVAAGPSAIDFSSGASSTRRRRTRRSSQQPMHDHLVISNFSSHSARAVCSSSTSMGPDFVSVQEQLFCEMSEKVLWSLCTDVLTEFCFSLEERVLRLRHLQTRTTTSTGDDTIEKSRYRHVQNWN